jgi:hypothetical protein
VVSKLRHGIVAVDFRAGAHYMPGWTMSEPSSMPPSSTAAAETFDPRRRRLCPDGSCVGLIGPDGRCRVCGLAHPDGPGDAAGAVVFSPAELDEDLGGGGERLDDHFALPAEGDEPGAFDAGRGLCPDGSCVGVLGTDGRCKVCGRRPEPAAGGAGA